MSSSDSEDEPPSLIQPSDEISSTPRRVPLTIISGFLGAGKSTLLKRILTEKHGYRIAVIMNEFGDTADIEAKSITISNPTPSSNLPPTTSEEFLELANGCLCCSIKHSGLAAIEALLLKKRLAFDYILLETTGLADPGPIASMFWQNEEYATGLADIVLDGIVCVVDAVFGQQQMEEDHATDENLQIGESLRQIASSDVILLNKTDLADESTLAQTELLIKQVNPFAPIHRTVRGQVELEKILGVAAFRKPPTNEHVHSEDCGHDGAKTHYQIRGISSLQVHCPVSLSQSQLDRLDEWIRTALWENRVRIRPGGDRQVQILRCKGLFGDEKGKWWVLQGVRNVYEISELGDMGVDVPDRGKIVLIGKGLDEIVRVNLGSILGS